MAVSGKMKPLGGRDPGDPLTSRVRDSGIEYAELNGVYPGSLFWGFTWRPKLVDRYLDVDGANFVRPGVRWELWYRDDTREEGSLLA